MRIVGHGIDLVEVERIARIRREHGERFIQRCFTGVERRYAEAAPKRCDEHLAARFAAKEAVLKALGTGWRNGIAWTDVEVVRSPSGQPQVKLTGQAAAIAGELGIIGWRLSLSHAGGLATASAIGLAIE